MKNKLLYTICFWLIWMNLFSQISLVNIKKANCQLFSDQLYAFGLLSRAPNETLCIYKLNSQLSVTDSLLIKLSKAKNENYLPVYSDTLHGFLNIYLQQENKNTVTIFRFSKTFELLKTIPSVDIARLNNTSLFDSDVFRSNDEVYSIKTTNDSSGKQFYINKFKLKSVEANFDYELKWQFPFERKNVENAHVFFANTRFLLVFVHVAGGTKKGEWILKLNSLNGQLIKASKINDKAEKNTYIYGSHYFDQQTKSVHFTGALFPDQQLDLSKKLWKIEDATHFSIYYFEMDSLGEIVNKQGFTLPIIAGSSGAKKVSSSYLLKTNDLKKSPEGGFVFDGDIYKQTKPSSCFQYVNSSRFYLTKSENGLVLKKNSLSSNNLIEDYIYTKDRMDLNGKLCMDSVSNPLKLMVTEPGMPVKLAFKLDEENNPYWLLNKHSFNKNNVNYSMVSPVKKIYQITSMEDIPENKSPRMLVLNLNQFVIFHQLEEEKFQLKLYTW